MTTAVASETGVNLRELTGAINLDHKSRVADVRGLQQLRIKMGAREMFRAEEMPNGDWREPNFEELKEITDRMDWAGARKTELQNKTARYKDIIEGNLTGEHLKKIGVVLGDMPGMVIALAKEAGISDPDSVSVKLKDGTFLSTNLKPIVERLGKDNRFVKRFKTTLADIKLTPEAAGEEAAHKVLTEEVERKTKDLDGRKRALDEAAKWHDDWEKADPAQAADFKVDIQNYDKYIDYLKKPNLPEHLKRNTILDSGDADAYINLLSLYTPANPTEQTAIDNALAYAGRIKTLYDTRGGYFNQDNIRRMRLYLNKDNKYSEIDKEHASLVGKVRSLEESKIMRKDKLNEYGHKIDIALETGIKRYYNEVLLDQAKKLAQSEARYKKGDTTKESQVNSVLDRFLTYGYFRFNRKGEPKGFDDKWIKKAAKSIKKYGPEGMAKLMMERVIRQKRKLSPQLRAEVDNLLKEINPENPEKPWETVSNNHLKKIGEANTPKLLGYAYAKNYWWDRIRFSQPQAEFIAANYSPDFWEQVFGNKATSKELLSKAIGHDVVNMDDGQFKDFLRKKLGENSVEFTKKLLKAAPYALAVGALGAGAYFGLPAIGITGKSVAAAAGEAGKFIGALAGETGKVIGGALTAAKTAGEGTAGAVGGALGATGQNIGNVLAGGPAGVGQATGEVIKGAFNTVAQTAGGVATGFNQAVQGVGKGISP